MTMVTMVAMALAPPLPCARVRDEGGFEISVHVDISGQLFDGRPRLHIFDGRPTLHKHLQFGRVTESVFA